MRARIIGVGSHVPAKVITNDDLAKMVETSDAWIRERTGIQERRVSDENTSTSDLAIVAAQKALAAAGLPAGKIDLVVVCTCSPDYLFPSVACIIQERLNLKNVAAFDLSAACTGFNYGLAVVSKLIEAGAYKNILLVGADTLTKYVDWHDRSVSILFGDGAGAAVLTASEEEGVLASYLMAEGNLGRHLIMPGGGSRDPQEKNGRFIKMDGKEVFKFAVRALETSVLKVLAEVNLPLSALDLLIPHQANSRIIDHVIKKIGLPKDKVYVNLQKYGNTSAASVPLALDEAVREGRVKSGDLLVLAGFGAGLTYGANIIKW